MSQPRSSGATLDRSRPASTRASGSRVWSAGGSSRSRAPRRWRWLLLVGLLVVLLAVAGWLVAFSSVLTARTVQVSGTRLLTSEDVRQAAAVPLGRPLARQDLPGIAARVATLPPVRSAQVTRKWPHTVVVSVVERQPLLAVRQGADYLLVDSAGVAFRTVAALPDGVTLATADPGDQALLSELGVVSAAWSPALAAKVATVQAAGRDSIRLTLRDGDTVVWGSAEQSELKAQVLTALLRRSATTYDVSAPGHPAVR